ncbi:MAG: hypothetical protein J7L08_00835, partial [Candidatus Aenigmarchaeota archaeon]|nr:hypothetical protein [Candidatus Aenigmarchaeota archaeon]
KIDYFVESTFTPMVSAFTGPLQGLQEGWSVLSNPVGYYQNYKPPVSTDESVGAVEVSTLEPLSDETITMPDQKVVVMATVENMGEEYGKDITFRAIPPTYAQGTDENKNAGSVRVNCGGSYMSSCNIDLLLPGEIRQYAMEYQIGEGKYLIRGNYISYGAEVSYDYSVQGKVAVSVMDEDYYYKLAENKGLTQQEQITKDSGGPLRLGIAVMRNKMPIKDNMGGVPIMIYLKNEGRGTVENIKSASIDISDLEGEGVRCVAGSETKSLEGILNKDGTIVKKIGPGEELKGYCYSTIPDIDVNQKTYQLTGKVDYTYSVKKERKMSIDFGSFYKCKCVNENNEQYILVNNCSTCSSSLCNDLFSGYSYDRCLGKQD